MWQSRFGISRVKRGGVAFGGGLVAIIYNRFAKGILPGIGNEMPSKEKFLLLEFFHVNAIFLGETI